MNDERKWGTFLLDLGTTTGGLEEASLGMHCISFHAVATYAVSSGIRDALRGS